MRWTKLFIPTLRESPAESKNAAHALLIRAGFMRRQDYLFLGRRVLGRLVEMTRREMDAAGAQEILAASPEAMLAIAGELRSYKQLPQTWYQFGELAVECRAFGGERNGLRDAMRRVLDRCRIEYAEGAGEMLALSQNGEPALRADGAIASLELADSRPQPPAIPDPAGDLAPEEFHTPGQKTIADLAAFTGLPESSQMKSVVMVAAHKPVLVMLRGDHQLSEAKLRRELCVAELRPAQAAEIREWFGADAGSLGPVGVTNMPVLADLALRGRRNLICGANRNDYHLRHVTPGEDFTPEFVDLRSAAAGDTAMDGSPLEPCRAIRLAQFHTLHRSLAITGESGEIAQARIATARLFLDNLVNVMAEQQSDADGLALVPSLAPFPVVITPVSNDEAQRRAAIDLCDALCAAGIEALLDDRDERPGVKFKDADLIGIPYRVTVGKKLAQGMVEIRDRRAKTSADVALPDAVSFLLDRLK